MTPIGGDGLMGLQNWAAEFFLPRRFSHTFFPLLLSPEVTSRLVVVNTVAVVRLSPESCD